MISMLAVLSWPLVVFWLFASRSPAIALIVSVLGAYLLLPTNYVIDLPAAPRIGKETIGGLAAICAAALLVRGARLQKLGQDRILQGFWPRSRVVSLLMCLMLAGVLGTVLTNGDPLRYGSRALSALRPYDIVSIVGNTMFMLLPFLLARKYLAHPDGQRTLLVGLAAAGILYSLPALYEARMSPQLSRMIYGYFPHEWRQHMRGGGFRPVVFLHHGLWLAIFFCSAFLAALALWRSEPGKTRLRWMAAAIWLLMTLVLAKGMGALAIGLLLGAMILLLPIRWQVLAAAAIGGIVLFYPMMRGAGLIPVDAVLSIAERVDHGRAASLKFRLMNEDMLLDKANDRPLFGWGTWGRNRVFSAEGKDLSVTDGYWIMSIGMKGWVGYLAEFGLLILPSIMLALRWRNMALTPATAGIMLALAANIIDLIPNATLTPVTWLMAGAVAGRLELGRISQTVAPPVPALHLRHNAYTRQTRQHPAQPAAGVPT